MADHVLDAATAVTKTQLNRMAARRSLHLGDDRLDRWHGAKITDPSSAIVGTSERGYTAAQADRILVVAEIAAGIKSKRPTASEIAFLLAYEGHEAPPLLVLEHVERSMLMFQRRIRRMLDGHGDGNLMRIDASKRLAPQVIRMLLRYASPTLARNVVLFEVGAATAEVVISLILKGTASANTFPMFTSLVSRIFPNATAEAPRMLWDLLHELMALLRLDEKNAIFAALKDACKEPEAALVAATDARRLLDVGSRVFPWMADADVLRELRWVTEDDRVFVNRYFPPIISGLVLAMRKDVLAQRRLADLRAGNENAALNDLNRMSAAGSEISDRFIQAFR